MAAMPGREGGEFNAVVEIIPPLSFEFFTTSKKFSLRKKI
jgi:hypothetical protein